MSTAADEHRIRLDVSAASLLVVCSCGWRELVEPRRLEAWQLGAEHQRQQLGRDGNAGATVRKARQRQEHHP